MVNLTSWGMQRRMWVSVTALLLPETKTKDEASRTPVATITVTNPALAKPQRGCVCVLTNGSGSHKALFGGEPSACSAKGSHWKAWEMQDEV